MTHPQDKTPPPSLSGSQIGVPLDNTPALALSSSQLWYRYWFFGWMFRDVNRPSLFERAAAWRHNQEQRRWLPTYLRRWALMSILAFGLAVVVEHGFKAQVLSALFYTQAVLGLTFNAVTSALMLGLKWLPGPF